MLARYPRPAVLARIPLDRHAVIEASAGTGKTYTIEHLVVDRLLRAECRLDQLLVVTFTDKATTELRARIRRLIEGVLAAPIDPKTEGVDVAAAEAAEPDVWFVDADRRQTLEEALFAFDRAPIHTIHAWCRRVLADMAFDSGQLFDQERVDGKAAFRKAWRVTLRTELAKAPEPRARLERWLRDGRDEADLERLLYEAHTKRYLEARAPVEDEMTQVFSALAADFDRGAILGDLLGAAIQKRSLLAAEQTLGAVQAALEHPGDRLGALLSLDLKPLLHPRRTAVGRETRRFPDGLRPATQRFLQRLARLRVLRGLVDSVEREVVEAFLPPVVERLEQGKRREGQFDYDDLLDRVWRALDGPDGDGLAATLRARYRYGLIDEFQDTDARQWAIFRRVFVDDSKAGNESSIHGIGAMNDAISGFSGPGDGKNAMKPGVLYVIGDPKQAIYGFRGADVHTYLDAREALLADAIRPAERVALRTNFRSSGPLIDALNHILDQDGRQPLFTGAIRYDEPVECGRPDVALRAADGGDAPPVVLFRHTPPRPRRAGERALSGWQLMRAYARGMADHLHRLLTDPAATLTVHEDDAEPRPVTARDIYCLVRTGREARDLEKALRDRGLACVVHLQDGLFATPEAHDVRDVLAATVDPHRRAARLKAFATPFFGVEWAVISGYRALPGDHPFIARIFEWHALAEQGRYAALFHAMLHDSGLVQRQLFLADDERRLTNYRHVLEILLEECTRRRLTIAEAIELTDRYIAGVARPEGSTAQRLADDRDAIQIMTMHKSKGLEAPVVCLYGFFLEGFTDRVQVVHDPTGRRVLVGDAAREAAADLVAREVAEEDQRLVYVALTRAKVRLLLPLVDSSRAIKGGYDALNRRLRAIEAAEELDPTRYAIEEVLDRGPRRRDIAPVADLGQPLAEWDPPEQLLSVEPPADPMDFAALRARHAPLVVTSYTRLEEARDRAETAPVEADEFKVDLGSETAPMHALDEEALPGGRYVGRFLHEVIERLPFSRFDGATFDDWTREQGVMEAFDWSMRRHEIEPRWRTISERIIWATLTRPVPIGDTVVEALWQVREQREMEFVYPIPEGSHPLLLTGDETERGWVAERGFVKGFIDLVFEHEGKLYWADWKSDILPDYAPDAIERHIADHYDLQARLYTLSMVRLLGVRDPDAYDARFGGLLYIFLRGFAADGPPGTGVYYARPTWDEVVAYEADMRDDDLLARHGARGGRR